MVVEGLNGGFADDSGEDGGFNMVMMQTMMVNDGKTMPVPFDFGWHNCSNHS